MAICTAHPDKPVLPLRPDYVYRTFWPPATHGHDGAREGGTFDCCAPLDPHVHRFGPFEAAPLTGNPVRRCVATHPGAVGCKAVSLDADEEA